MTHFQFRIQGHKFFGWTLWFQAFFFSSPHFHSLQSNSYLSLHYFLLVGILHIGGCWCKKWRLSRILVFCLLSCQPLWIFAGWKAVFERKDSSWNWRMFHETTIRVGWWVSTCRLDLCIVSTLKEYWGKFSKVLLPEKRNSLLPFLIKIKWLS